MTKRKYDDNGWLEVADNPISKVGVFPYLGSEIGAPEPDRIYYVYRPADELSNQDTIESFKLLPFIDDHEWLGKDGTAAEKKGVQGFIGEQIRFEDPYLLGNIRVVSNAALTAIDSGKIELSPGYKATYEFASGEFNGERYDAIQRNIRGNHLALVQEGRTGADVSVQDHVITIDTAELIKMTLEELLAKIAELSEEEKASLLAALTPAATDADEDEEKAKDAEVGAEEDVDPAAATAASAVLEAAVEEVVAAAEEAAAAAATGDPETVVEAEESIEAAEEKLDEASYDLEEAVMDSLSKRLKAAKRAVKTGDTVSALKAKIKRLERKALDSKQIMTQIAERDALAARVSKHVGTFDSAAMTKLEVAQYGVKKLGIKCPAGSEHIALDAYLQAAVADADKPSTKTADSSSVNVKSKLWGKK